MEDFYIPEYGTFEEWDRWYIDMKLKHPYQYFFKWILPNFIGRMYNTYPRDWYYQFTARFWHKYNVIKTDLPPTWHDRDHLMFHACFTLLKDFIEKERPWEATASKTELVAAYGLERANHWVKLQKLYSWWIALESGIELDEHQEKLEQLVKYRRYMWT
jgi:hypothetical protein